MEVTSPETATLAIWTIARFSALAVLATEALFFYARRRDPQPRPPGRIFWALIPALVLAGLCFWCTVSLSDRRAAFAAGAVAQLARCFSRTPHGREHLRLAACARRFRPWGEDRPAD